MTRRYPAYRASGVEWLGEVPEGWDVVCLKHGCHVFPSNVDKHTIDGEIPVLLCNYTDVYYNDVITPDLAFMAATAKPEEIEKFTLQVGDVVFTKDSETSDDIGIAALITQELPGVVCGYHLSIARPHPNAYGPFIKRFFDSMSAKAYFEVNANGLTRVGLGQYAIDNLPLPLPPLPEQRAIAGFLDRETAKIDALVAEQRRLIDLLREKRQAVISHAVTRGLNPKAPLKPSGIDWLGDVPEGWEVVRLKSVLAEPLKYGANEAAADDDPDQPRFVRITDIDGRGRLREDTFRSLPYATAEQYLLEAGDILLARSGATVGKSFLYSAAWGQCCYAGYLIRARPKKSKVLPDFLYLYAQSDFYWQYLGSNQIQSTIQNFNAEKYSNLWLPLPPISDQAAIVAKMKDGAATFDTLTATADSAITLLQERRAALISAAVTGKIDVRASAPTETEAA